MEEQQLTKREKRELAKEAKREEQEKGNKARILKKLFIWFLTAGIILFVGFKAWKWITAPTPEVAGETTQVTESDWVRGDKEGKVVLLEYGDFQCPACANYAPLVKRLTEEVPQGLKVVYRHFPLPQHRNAIPAALAAEAAGAQGKFWEMQDMLYAKQADWENVADAKDIFISYAKDLGLDENKFKEDLEKGELKDKIQADKSEGQSLGINATPTFFLNGGKITPRSYEEFKKLVEDQIQGFNIQ